ncbi:MAG: hypothetical protein D6711_19090 [Chloroflexi bacterium]|nr:MAG: hypothetical protein D6711_19090 [Chloroflexota bacterium]
MFRIPLKLSRRQQFIFVLVWLLAALSVLNLWPSGDQNEFKTITHERYGFSLQYPARWRAALYGENGLRGNRETKLRITGSGLEAFSVNVYYQQLEHPTMEDAIKLTDAYIKRGDFYASSENLPLCTLSERYEELLKNKIVIKQKYNCHDSYYYQVLFPRQNDIIIIEYEASSDVYEKYLPEFEAIVNSFTPLD